nr:ABC transporter permease [Pyrinomonadaceae bacterium]
MRFPFMRFPLRLPGFIPRETLLMALGSLHAHKFRSFLTVLGIVIGITTAISIASILTGLRGQIVKIIEEYGTNNIYAYHLTTGPQVGERDQKERARKPLTPEDAEAIRTGASHVQDVAQVSPNIGYWGGAFDDTVSYNGKNYRRGNTQGVTPNYGGITNVTLREGRFFTEFDDASRRNVMVIGVNAADALFPNPNNIVGREVKMGGHVFEIIGVLEKRKNGVFGENEEDNHVLVPFRTGLKIAPGRRYLELN